MLNTMIEKVIAERKAADDQYVVSFESIGKLTLKKQAGIKYSVGEISNWVTKWLVCDCETIRLALIASKYSEGTKLEYVGLTPVDSNSLDEYKDETTKAKVFKVSYALDKACNAEIQNCIWSDANINKYRFDMVKIGRLYQEKTIDYAKKISFLDIIPSPMRFVTLLSLKKLELVLEGEAVKLNVPAYESSKNRIVYNDAINQARIELAEDFKISINDQIIPFINENAKLPKEMDEQLQSNRFARDIDIFLKIKDMYKDIVGGFSRIKDDGPDNEDESINVAKEAFKSDKARLENMLRMATRYMSDEQRGAYMKYVAGRTKNNMRREDGTENRFYLALCREEFIKWLMSMGLNEIDVAGYRLLGNKGYEDGDMVWFDNGQAGKAIIDGKHTGWLDIKEIDGQLYATQDLNELITVPEVNNEIIVKVQQGFVGSWGADAVVKALNTATTVSFSTTKVPVKYRGRNEEKQLSLLVECTDGKTRNIPFDLSPALYSMLRNSAGSVIKVSKNKIRTQTGSEIDSVYINIDLNTMPEVCVPAEASYQDEEPIEIVVSDEI